MIHKDFKIGCEFTTAEGSIKWTCTDIGTRTIAAIRTGGPFQIAEYNPQTEVTTTRDVTDPKEIKEYLAGPPYEVVEYVFDENDFPGCDPFKVVE